MIFDIKSIHSVFPITGAIHVGAFVGEELLAYRSIGLSNTMLFEPQEDLYNIVKSKTILGERVFNTALGSKKEKMTMNISYREGGIENGCGASSSLLKPKKHLEEHPEVLFLEEKEVEVNLLDDFYEDGYNFLNIDVQGFELEVLKGATKSLEKIDSMILEVNCDEVYEGCPLVEDLDKFLLDFGFQRIETVMQSKSWGDAIYAKV